MTLRFLLTKNLSMGKNLIMRPKDYFEKNKIKVADAAVQLGVTRQHLYDILKEKTSAGKALALRFEKWSKGEIHHDEVLFPKN